MCRRYKFYFVVVLGVASTVEGEGGVSSISMVTSSWKLVLLISTMESASGWKGTLWSARRLGDTISYHSRVIMQPFNLAQSLGLVRALHTDEKKRCFVFCTTQWM